MQWLHHPNLRDTNNLNSVITEARRQFRKGKRKA
jgi:hypothetical protein